MADVSENGEFWLPPQFLADNDDDDGLFMNKSEVNNSPKSLLPSGFGSFGFTSPSSTETESDEEDYLDGLTREMARYTLEDDFSGKDENTSKGLLGPPVRKPSGFFYPTQFQQSQLMKQQNSQVWGDKKPKHVVLQSSVSGCNNNSRPLGLGLLPSACPPLQQQSKQQNGSDMQTVFLGNPNGKRECAGTGVFLPRRIGTAQPRKKQAYSTVLVPARVVEALNLNHDEINAQHQLGPRFKASGDADSGGVSRFRRGGNGFANPKQRRFSAEQGTSHEIRLPREWTY